MSKTSNAPPVLMLVGPTASGKSAAAMRLAQTAAIEIISVDSAQVYRGMDVGTAKPSMAEREQVRHHLIDLVDPATSYSAAQFAEDTERLIDEIRTRNHHPVLVGGTMMYIKALTQGLNTLPSADPAIRERLDALAAQVGWPDMHRQLAKHDPETAARLSPNDSQRIQRALEVIEITGHPMSALLAQPAPAAADKHRFAMISLEPSNRAILHQRIAERFHAMIEQGLIDEVRALRKREDLHVGLPSIRCVGYRQIWQWIDAGESADQLSSAIDAAIAATRQLAKRQLTWLRNSTDRTIIDSNATDATEQAVEVARKLLNCSTP